MLLSFPGPARFGAVFVGSRLHFECIQVGDGEGSVHVYFVHTPGCLVSSGCRFTMVGVSRGLSAIYVNMHRELEFYHLN